VPGSALKVNTHERECLRLSYTSTTLQRTPPLAAHKQLAFAAHGGARAGTRHKLSVLWHAGGREKRASSNSEVHPTPHSFRRAILEGNRRSAHDRKEHSRCTHVCTKVYAHLHKPCPQICTDCLHNCKSAPAMSLRYQRGKQSRAMYVNGARKGGGHAGYNIS
jgi:hypothetical protein